MKMTKNIQDTKPHQVISLDHILDALEDDSISAGTSSLSPPIHSHGHGYLHGVGGVQMAGGDDTSVANEGHGFVFKIVTTKRTLVLSAPSEAEEIKWLSTVRALIARRGTSPGPLGGSKLGVGLGRSDG